MASLNAHVSVVVPSKGATRRVVQFLGFSRPQNRCAGQRVCVRLPLLSGQGWARSITNNGVSKADVSVDVSLFSVTHADRGVDDADGNYDEEPLPPGMEPVSHMHLTQVRRSSVAERSLGRECRRDACNG